jgi:dipeptidase E
MSLFLASTVKHPDVIKAMKEYVGGFEGKNMVYIPTAAHVQEGFGVYKSGGTYTLMNSLGSNLQILELECVEEGKAKEMIEKADILFMAGGYPVYLSYWLHRRNLKDFIKERVKGGMLYIGTSAGAMVCSKTLTSATYFDKDPFADVAPGLGYINYEIWPHYEDEHKDVIETDYKDVKIKPLRDGEYIVEMIG